MWEIIIPAVAAIGSAITSAVSAKKAQKRQNKANLEMQNLANQQNVDMWNMQNEYNSPSAQMERLSQAGLNPYLYNAGSNTAGAIAPSHPAEQTYSSFADKGLQAFMQVAQLGDVFLNLKAKQEGIENVKANRLLTEAKTEVEKQRKMDWLFKNTFGYSNAKNRALMLALNQSKLYNEYMTEWNTNHPLLRMEMDSDNGYMIDYDRKPLTDSEFLNSLGYSRGQNTLDFLHYGAGLRELEYNWKKSQYDAGLAPNSPWWASFVRNAYDKISVADVKQFLRSTIFR